MRDCGSERRKTQRSLCRPDPHDGASPKQSCRSVRLRCVILRTIVGQHAVESPVIPYAMVLIASSGTHVPTATSAAIRSTSASSSDLHYKSPSCDISWPLS